MELEKLLKEREAFARQLTPMIVRITSLLLIPAIIAFIVIRVWNAPVLLVFALAIVISWFGIIRIYQKTSKQIDVLDTRIRTLQEQQSNSEELPTSHSSEHE